MQKTCYKLHIGAAPVILSQFIAKETGISLEVVNDIIEKGAVWLMVEHRAKTRIKDKQVKVGPYVDIGVYFDESLYFKEPPQSDCLEDLKQYSIWFKPSGLLTQGNLYGDYLSLLRQVEQHFGKRRAYLIHRLDIEVSGIVLVAHNKKVAGMLGKMLQEHKIRKTYRARVLGELNQDALSVELPLDGKYALTEYKVIDFDQHNNTSMVEIQIKTGRFHQIRRHFDLIGHPILGDPKYGTGNKNVGGLQLQAVGLDYMCPVKNRTKQVVLPEEKLYIK